MSELKFQLVDADGDVVATSRVYDSESESSAFVRYLISDNDGFVSGIPIEDVSGSPVAGEIHNAQSVGSDVLVFENSTSMTAGTALFARSGGNRFYRKVRVLDFGWYPTQTSDQLHLVGIKLFDSSLTNFDNLSSPVKVSGVSNAQGNSPSFDTSGASISGEDLLDAKIIVVKAKRPLKTQLVLDDCVLPIS